MKKLIKRVKDLGRKAQEIKGHLEKIPPKVSELKEAFAVTTHQLKEVQSSIFLTISDLKVEDNDRLLGMLGEINGSTEVFEQAGYELGGVELELNPVSRLNLRLNRFETVSSFRLHTILSANSGRKTTQAILKAMVQAEEVASKSDWTGLVYHQLQVTLGAIPMLKLCWGRSDSLELSDDEEQEGEQRESISSGISQSTSLLEGYGAGSFFQPSQSRSDSGYGVREAARPHSPAEKGEDKTDPKGLPESPLLVQETPEAPVANLDPLAKFRKMPDLTRRRKI